MDWKQTLLEGVAIPAHPLALTADRKLDERRQRGLTRYYLAAGAGGVAVGVHTTQFAIHDANVGLYRPVLELAREEWRARGAIGIAGIVGDTGQAVSEAEYAAGLGYHSGLVSLAALSGRDEDALIEHVSQVSRAIPVFGFYLQPAVGGRVLSHAFWRRFLEIENVVAIKIAPFNRYQTLDVVRALALSGRQNDIALYTGNDDNIVLDLLTAFEVEGRTIRIRGGLLGHWSVWTKSSVRLLAESHDLARQDAPIPAKWLARAQQVTDANAAFFDAANGFRGCIAGLHEVLRRQGLLAGTWCWDPHEQLSPGQAEEIDRVYRQYPEWNDDVFVAEHRDEWLRP
ncbi:dihydrodipicolinate synthase family protein [uncultured Paludibaculum sp.]|uniref:dihydrodipicolinate synthase family protein n=1 Tax=uncultured Paludibaculum sp. TaxID=1765020 RepID=UPI002AAACF23|nr:dihydrodipicolinate synthase family protein [uncultured Paludibaculum sp.]